MWANRESNIDNDMKISTCLPLSNPKPLKREMKTSTLTTLESKTQEKCIERQQLDQSRMQNRKPHEKINMLTTLESQIVGNEKNINMLTALESNVQGKTDRKSTCGPISNPHLKWNWKNQQVYHSQVPHRAQTKGTSTV